MKLPRTESVLSLLVLTKVVSVMMIIMGMYKWKLVQFLGVPLEPVHMRVVKHFMRLGIALALQCDSLLTSGLANLNPREGHIIR
jgi:hypothetical protein